MTSKVQYVVMLNTMGQDRIYSEEQRLLALREVQSYRDQWEKVEIENLKADITAKIERSEGDLLYREKHMPEDDKELAKVVEEAVQTAAAAQDDGDVAEDKEMTALKAKFVTVTRTFHAPDLAVQHKAKLERMAKDSMRHGSQGDRAASAMGSAASQAGARS